MTLKKGDRYVVWDAYEQQIIEGYYVGDHKVDISTGSQSCYTPIYSDAYCFASSSLKKPWAKYTNKVAKEAATIIACLSDMNLSILKKPEPKEI